MTNADHGTKPNPARNLATRNERPGLVLLQLAVAQQRRVPKAPLLEAEVGVEVGAKGEEKTTRRLTSQSLLLLLLPMMILLLLLRQRQEKLRLNLSPLLRLLPK